ncbi:MAG: HAD hydrolase family protein [Burkholderiaceae bacterium]
MAPQLHFSPELLLKAQDLSVVFFDVDGVMTDGALYFTEAGETLKRFHVLDGHGMVLLQQAGIVPAVVTGRDAKALRVRLDALGLVHVRFGTTDKVTAAQSILDALGKRWDQAAAMGDDWPDLPLLRSCALAVAPPNAHAEVLAVADYVTPRGGGHGAVRDLCDLLLVASGRYANMLEAAGK